MCVSDSFQLPKDFDPVAYVVVCKAEMRHGHGYHLGEDVCVRKTR
jgi:hypothetical protein